MTSLQSSLRIFFKIPTKEATDREISFDDIFQDELTSFRWRFALPFTGCTCPKWVLFTVSFGYSFSFTSEPPPTESPPETLSSEVEHSLLQRLQDCSLHPSSCQLPCFLRFKAQTSCDQFMMLDYRSVLPITDFLSPRASDPFDSCLWEIISLSWILQGFGVNSLLLTNQDVTFVPPFS